MPERISLPGNRFLLLGVAMLLLCLSPRARAGEVPEFHCFLRPIHLCDIFLGDTLEVHFDVDSTAVQFNGYELTLEYDPDVLEFLDISEGSLMSDACATRFQNVVFTDSTLTYSHVTLCAGVSIDGPGRLSSFRFVATGAAETEIRIASDPDRLFVDAGLWVWPEHSSFPRQVVYLDDGKTTFWVNDPDSADLDDFEAGATRLSGFDLRLVPNPTHGSVRVDLAGPLRSGVHDVEILSADGRRVGVRHRIGAGHRSASVPLEDQNGSSLSAGSYFVRVRAQGGEEAVQKLVIVK